MPDLENDIRTTFGYFSGKPQLQLIDDAYLLRGILYCCVGDDRELYECADVAICIPLSFPKAVPLVIENARFPRGMEYHINQDGLCCLGTSASIFDYMRSQQIETFGDFLQKIIIVFFWQVKHFLVKGTWPFRTEEHHATGIIDSYMRIFRMDRETLLGIARQEYDENCPCLCRSGQSFGACHGRYMDIACINKELLLIRQEFSHRHSTVSFRGFSSNTKA